MNVDIEQYCREESDCIVCFTTYDDHRPRVLQCGHTYHVNDLPVNFSFEGLLKKKRKVDESLPNCNQLTLKKILDSILFNFVVPWAHCVT